MQEQYRICEQVILEEMMPALGCTEPIALAYAAAKAAETLGAHPTSLRVDCSGNIIKNVMGAVVPNSGGMKGVAAAAVLGALGGDAGMGLQVLQAVTPESLLEAQRWLKAGLCACHHAKGEDALYLLVTVYAGDAWASVEIRHAHTNITRIQKNGQDVFVSGAADSKQASAKMRMTMDGIYAYACAGAVAPVQKTLEMQIALNTAIAAEGLENAYGARVGSTLNARMDQFTWCRMLALAAAGSDARMAGCTLPVVINSGSGNQGLTVSLPLIAHAEEIGATRERLLRALMLGNLISLHIKAHIGNLSAFCGAVSAACGAAAGIAFLDGKPQAMIEGVVTNTLLTTGGMVCDGAKSSCAAKIATALFGALLCYELADAGQVFPAYDGVGGKDVEDTIDRIGRMCRKGMEKTDEEILAIMLDRP